MTYKTLSKLAKQRATLPIINTVRVLNGVVTATDLDVTIEQPYADKKAKGLFHGIGFDKGFNVDTGLPITDFPDTRYLLEDDITGTCKLNADQIEVLKWVLKAASTEETRYYLNGVAFCDQTLVATDGHRLHSFDAQIAWKEGSNKVVIVPRHALNLILELYKELKADVLEFTFNGIGHLFTCHVGDAVVTGRLIDGTFPDYQRVVPAFKPEVNDDGTKNEHFTRTTPFDHTDFVKAIPIVGLFGKMNGNGRGVAVKLGKGEAMSTGEKPYRFKTKSQFELEVGFNIKYLAGLISGMAEYTDYSSPMKVTCNRGGIKKLAVIMPLRV